MSAVAPSLGLLSFEDACERVLDYLKTSIPLGFWSVSRYTRGRQVYLHVRDDAYGKTTGESHAWSDSFCQFMATGETPQIAPDAMAVPQYAAAGVAQVLTIGSYIGIPIRGGGGQLFGTLCGLDPQTQDPTIRQFEPMLHLLVSLLGQILHADELRATAAEREAELHWLAYHDNLTRLPNRAMFFDRLNHALALHRRDLRGLGVLLVDLDDFKAVNDTDGHASGDELLVQVAERLAGQLREGDTVARLGGDEFAVLLEDGGSPTVVAHRLASAFAEPFTVGGRELTVGASIGFSELAPSAAVVTAEVLLERADRAMYAAKHEGKSRVVRFSAMVDDLVMAHTG